ncbi:MAG TPA: L,D-transpeptidase family protein [Chitinophagaceae bacterium]|nr:L,D-transpeptidase family protein [Chitinophagaceae bacterium]
MKLKNLIVPISFLFLISCNNSDTRQTTEEGNAEMENVDSPEEKTAKAKKITDRDHSVTPENAYNDMFLDSLAMESYISTRELADKKIANRIRSFYNARNYQYAWFSSGGLTEQARFFWNQYDYAVNHLKDTTLADKDFFKKAESYINQEKLTANSGNADIRNVELGFTEHFIRYINSTYEKGYVKRKEQERFIPIKKVDPLAITDSLLNKKHKDEKYYEDVNPLYGALKKQLAIYYPIAKAGGWPTIPAIKSSLKKGAADTVITLIKKRLQVTQDMPGTDLTNVFNDTLETAVKRFQRSLGYKQDGIISPNLVKDMNIPAVKRLTAILLNMDRMRWMPQQPKGNLIIVNIPEFMLHVYDGDSTIFDMVVVVGKEGNNTMMFNGNLNQVIFSPYWNVPASIIKNEIMPAIARNPNYLASKNMEQNGSSIRQRPGPGNALGKVKFIFPNSFNMYFHDTPSKGLFNEDKRAFSHGCIRLQDPQKMAEWLLRNDPAWDTEKIVAAMNKGVEKPVKLKDPVPVFIIYYTAWVDKDGQLNFRDDVYKHDAELVKKMFVANGSPAIAVK